MYHGGYYYLDYDVTEPCFLFINRPDMECILPKKGFVLKNKQVIPNTDCNVGENFDSNILFSNPYSMECQDSGKSILYCVEIDYTNTDSCKRCLDSFMIPSNNCACPDGMYIDKATQKCKYCSKICKTCSISADYCLICNESDQIPPYCNCPYSNQYIDSNYQCQFCNNQCSECSEDSNQCKTCSQGRINPPLCKCDPRYSSNLDSDPISKDCDPIPCLNICNTCEYKADNCIKCKGDRINPPVCECEEGKYEHPTEQLPLCSQCDEYFFYNFEYKECQQCSELCASCNGPLENNCKTCRGNLSLNKINQCICDLGSERVDDFENPYSCYRYMSTITYLNLQNNKYRIILEFEFEVDQMEEMMRNEGINNLFILTISQIPESTYLLKDFSVRKSNQLILHIEFSKSFQATTGFLIFKKTDVFKNQIKKAILDPIYTQKPYQFTIGPYIDSDSSFIGTVSLLSSLNQDLIGIIRNLQFLFYILNSIQPTAMFLLVKIKMPINFYSLLSLFGIFVYRDMPEQSDSTLKGNYNLMGQNVDEYLRSSGSFHLDRFGFRDSFLINCQIIFYKYLALSTFIISLSIIRSLCFDLKKSRGKQKRLLQQMINFLIIRLSKENEVNLLMIIMSICIQFTRIQESNWLNRLGLYFATFVGLTFLLTSFWFYSKYNSKFFLKYKNLFEIFFLRLNYDKLKRNWFVKNYHFIYLLKKVIIICLIFALVDNPQVLCYLGAILNILSAIFSLYIRPYKFFIQSLIKVAGDILLFLVWTYMILFYKFFNDRLDQILFSDSEVKEILSKGFVASIFILLFNLVFFLSFLFENFIAPIIWVCRKKKVKVVAVLQKRLSEQITDQPKIQNREQFDTKQGNEIMIELFEENKDYIEKQQKE